MAQRITTIALALADPGRSEALAAALSEERDLVVADVSEQADLFVTDGPVPANGTPGVSWGGDPPAEANIRATLSAATDVQTVVAAIRLAAAGFRIERDLRNGQGAGTSDERHHLSAREREVLALLAEGAPNKVIARRLGISVHTAKFHVAAVVGKLGAANRTEAIGIAMREGLVLI